MMILQSILKGLKNASQRLDLGYNPGLGHFWDAMRPLWPPLAGYF
jgi:hypothetical protein